MADLIERATLSEQVKGELYQTGYAPDNSFVQGWIAGFNAGIGKALSHIACADRQNVVEIVEVSDNLIHCKDCKHGENDNSCIYCHKHHMPCGNNYSCSDGERKSGDSDV